MKINNLEKLTINISSSFKEGISVIDQGQLKIALVIDEKKQLKGILTDGDVRRGLLNNIDLSDSISKVMNRNFITASIGTDKRNIESLMEKNSILQIPLVDENNLLKAIFINKSLINRSMKIIPNSVVLMAGGEGKRLRPLTENCPKPMLKINGKPILEILLDKLIDSGFRNFYLSVNYLKGQIIDYFKDGESKGIKIQYLVENRPLGTAGSLTLLTKKLDDPILVMNADVLTKFDPSYLLYFHNKNNAQCTIAVHRSEFQIPFGIVKTRGLQLAGFQEKPTINQLVNAGVYVINPEILYLLEDDKFTDMPSLIMEASRKKFNVIVCPIHEYWIDIGIPEKLNQVLKDLNKDDI